MTPDFMEKHWPTLSEQCDQAAAEGAARARSVSEPGAQATGGARLVNCTVCGQLGPLPELPPGATAGMVICQDCNEVLTEPEMLLLQSGFVQGVRIGIKTQYRYDCAALAAAQQEVSRLGAEARWLRKSEAQVVKIARHECSEGGKQTRYWKKAWSKTLLAAIVGWLLWLVALLW
jgi:hypothetical protein